VDAKRSVPDQPEAPGRIGEGEGVVSFLGLEPRVTGVLPRLATTPEGLECQLDSFVDLMEAVVVNEGYVWILGPPVLDESVGVVEGEGPSLVGVGVSAGFEAEVVCLAAPLNGSPQFRSLPVCRKQAEPEGLPHLDPPWYRYSSHTTEKNPACDDEILGLSLESGSHPWGNPVSPR